MIAGWNVFRKFQQSSCGQDVGKVLQKQMADMLMMQDSTEEKMIGFAASEVRFNLILI